MFFKKILLFGAVLGLAGVFTSCDKNEEIFEAQVMNPVNEVEKPQVSALGASNSSFGTALATDLRYSPSDYIDIGPGESYYVEVNGGRLQPLYFYVKNETANKLLVEAYLGGNVGYSRWAWQNVSSYGGSLFTFVGKDLNASYASLIIRMKNTGGKTIRGVKWNANFID